ncbi:hypothetical protein POM88_033231 [Heracleum sosnowskyi]|uniref:Late embryogenesis abundant protein LEA-2 subgroup domain-containing protein n=1 Tax=Heracleum sosnowskyi TaxID=360622 RepID=A0AAD8I361_9APIA|nr:hypothetical protein POM88_033231 [Heracleum sosnowskyi]
MTVYPDDLYLPPSPSKTPIREKVIDCCVICATVLAVILLVVFVIFISNRFVKMIDAEVPMIEIDSITVSNFSLSNPISAHWNINMTMHSTRSSFEFSDSTVSIFHKSKEEAVWMTRLNGFDMRPKNTTFHFALDFGGLADVNDTTLRAIGDGITDNFGTVEFSVQFKADHSRSRDISRLKKFYENYSTVVNILINWDVLLLLGSPDKTRAMLMTKESSTQFC